MSSRGVLQMNGLTTLVFTYCPPRAVPSLHQLIVGCADALLRLPDRLLAFLAILLRQRAAPAIFDSASGDRALISSFLQAGHWTVGPQTFQ